MLKFTFPPIGFLHSGIKFVYSSKGRKRDCYCKSINYKYVDYMKDEIWGWNQNQKGLEATRSFLRPKSDTNMLEFTSHLVGSREVAWGLFVIQM